MLSVTSMVYVGDSDDSDTEGGLGNVERVVMRPPGHSGKAKRGHLCFDASFETGNLGRVDFITENEYDLFIRPDTCNPRVRFWFHFTVDNVQEDQRVIFNIVNHSRTRNLFQQGMTPVVRSTSRKKWTRLPSNYVYYYQSPEHSNNIVLSFAFAFDQVEGEKYDFALTFPYSYTRCKMVEQKIAKRTEYVRLETFAKSTQKRELSMVTITDNVDADVSEGKRLVVIMARSHPGEPLSSFVIQGMMEFLSSDHGIAKDLRSKIVFKFFPMLNPDGVFLGNSRCTLLGSDLNRCWHIASEHQHPILYAVKQYILTQSKKCPLDFVIDLHCSSSLLGIFVQGNSYDSVYRNERHSVFPKMMTQNCPDFILSQTMYNADPEKEGTARRFLGQVLADQTNVYSLEVSMYGHFSPAKKAIIPYTEEDYSVHGRRICRAFWDYFKVMNIINDSCYKPFNIDNNDGAGLGEAGFSMVRLKEIAKQRELFSSIESLSEESSEEQDTTKKDRRADDDDDDDESDEDDSSSDESSTSRTGIRGRRTSKRKSTREKTQVWDESSITSSMQEFIHENSLDGSRRLDFLGYRRSLRQRQLLEALQRRGSFKIVGRKIEKPDENPGRSKKTKQGESYWDWQATLDPDQHHLMLPYNIDPKQTQHILTISRVKLRPALNDKVQPQPSDATEEESFIWQESSSALEKHTKKYVGGGGVIVRLADVGRRNSIPSKESNSAARGSSPRRAKQNIDSSIHVDIRLDQLSTINPLKSRPPSENKGQSSQAKEATDKKAAAPKQQKKKEEQTQKTLSF